MAKITSVRFPLSILAVKVSAVASPLNYTVNEKSSPRISLEMFSSPGACSMSAMV